MTERDWKVIEETKLPAKVILVAPAGVPVVIPVWIERDEGQLLFLIGDVRFGALVVRAVREHHLSVWLEDPAWHRTFQVEGTAELVSDPAEVARWDSLIWHRYMGSAGRVHSSEHSKMLVRLTPATGDAWGARPQELEEQYYCYPGESGAGLMRKVLFQVNELAISRSSHAVLLHETSTQVHLVHSADVVEARGRVKVDSARLIPMAASVAFISKIFEGGPNWVNVSVYLSDGKPRIISLLAPPTDALQSRSGIGGGILTSWRDDVTLELS